MKKLFLRILIIQIFFVIGYGCQLAPKYIELPEKEAKESLYSFVNDTTNNLYLNKVLINNANLAINIAEPILFNIYGKNKILKEQPYQIRLVDNYWIIIGSTSDNNLKGGSFEIIISSRNGAIKGLSHGK